jgi:hypothetical protein
MIVILSDSARPEESKRALCAPNFFAEDISDAHEQLT